MKKLASIILLFLCIIVISSCTDDDIADNQAKDNNEIKNTDYKLIEKDKVETPTTKGKDTI